MSLTSQLQAKGSPLSTFLREHLPQIRPATDSFRNALADVEAGPLLLPQAPAGVRPLWGTLGAAVDHRLRYAFTTARTWDTAVTLGVQAAAACAWAEGDVAAAHAFTTTGNDLHAALDEVLARQAPDDRDRELLLPLEAEEHLGRLCMAMAWFEEIYRSGYLAPASPLGTLRAATTLPSLLQRVPDYAVRDLTAQIRNAHTVLGPLRAATTPDTCRSGPTFAGSTDIDGADADLIADGLLIDIKATKDATRLAAPALRQLIGYALLDYSDQYGLNRVGLYLTRTARLVTWDVEELLQMMGAQAPLPTLRAALSRHLARATT
ncbi:hypothetical protein SAMN05216223_12310 [Actinacidiphila yanglinensis]|uniref:Uncharacterized protein n=1 Tax=Actinacidiphila yanglinensis TaxID=310779 RepID=A0A1H6E0H2_9ACTN|nr:hypothetical protein SAMN05216223_11610 [Actinacidiphila yanglinensis]SEG91027.1 hypothetical protein SAMN05216223_12310 [Actinacidiphila yanglinensis]